MMYRKNAWNSYDETALQQLEAFASDYRKYIDNGKTERECVTESVAICEAAGFMDLDKVLAEGKTLQPGDRVYRNWLGKAFMAFIVGSEPITKGMNVLGAHIDSPRMDIKQNPLFETDGFAYLDTHYYGGIKKYQWITLPLALHGVVAKKDGTSVQIAIGDKPEDPVLCISDILIHLAAKQMGGDVKGIIDGEKLDVIIGSRPLQGEEKEPVKQYIVKLLQDCYGIEPEDFVSAELELVPAGLSRDMGLDRSMIIGYGHDDRCCSYPSLRAVIDYVGVPERTLCCILTDKEEIGSVGNTGMQSRYFENTVAELYNAADGAYSELGLRRLLANSVMLSSDVNAGFDPNFAGCFEKKNAAMLGWGVCFSKFTGARGKSGSNDANAEFVAAMRAIMDEANVHYQTAELGAVDVGGGGTIAYICANLGMQVIDAGIPVLNMHAPWEIISKADIWEEYKAYCAFLAKAGK